MLTENSRTLSEALQPESLSCTAAAQAIVRLTSLTDHAGWVDTGGDGADDHRRFTRGLLHVLANGADAILPQTSAKLRSTFRIPQVPFTEDPFTADLGTSHVRT